MKAGSDGRRRAYRIGGVSLVALAGLVGCAPLLIDHDLPLPPAVPAERLEINARAGRLSYYVAGEGPPLLLVHSINAAGSAYEVRPIFERARARHRVYAVDLPGFGFSDRSPRRYDARRYDVQLYVEAIHDMLDVIAADTGPAPVDALALSLSSEFLARAATQTPQRLRSLTLVTPTGFSKAYRDLQGAPGATREIPGFYGFFTFPLWSQGIYDLLVSRRSIRYFLERTWGAKDIDEGLLDYDYLTTHQPGAKNAPYAFVSGRLFSKDIRSVYEQLRLPVWVPHGTRGDFGDFSAAGWTRTRPNWQVQAWATGALPQFERPDAFDRDLTRFLAEAGGKPQPTPSAQASLSAPRSPSP